MSRNNSSVERASAVFSKHSRKRSAGPMPLALGATCAIGAGLLGTLAASSAKLALGDDYLRATCQAVLGKEEITGEACIWVRGRLCCGRSGWRYDSLPLRAL